MPHRKPHLPQKICAACGRPFAWRKRWQRNWLDVKYCSAACRRHRHDCTQRDSI